MKHIIILFITIFTFPLLASEEVILVTFVSGQSYRLYNGQEVKLKRYDMLRQNDEIITRKGKVDLQIGKTGVIRISNNSHIKFTEYFENNDKSRTILETERGKVFSKIVKPLNKDSKFEIHSPTHVAGVRGTEFVFSEGISNDKKYDDSDIPAGVFVNKGKVELKSTGSNKREIAGENEQIVTSEKGMQKDILAEFMKEKMKIFKSLKEMKEMNYQMIKEQKLKNEKLMRSFNFNEDE